MRLRTQNVKGGNMMHTQFFRLVRHLGVWAALVGLGLTWTVSPVSASQYDTPGAEFAAAVLEAGPIHEAFAETVAFNPEPGIIVPKAPPDPINEVPPEQKPEGSVEWIHGYWAWDDDRNDFIWVSGIWRAIPPDRRWVPGHWSKIDTGYQWMSGYWAMDRPSRTEYLPEPPPSLETGPNVAAPSSDYGWIPGCWIWMNGRYAWRPGYWAVMRPDWIWVPAHYVWRPRGYIFVRGYWDFAIMQRGVLFAPVFFPYRVALFSPPVFRPSYVINLSVFSDLIFWRPHYRHYYFGNYYAPKYRRIGILPWCSFHVKRYGFVPIYAHQRWKHRHDRNWEHRLQAKYDTLRKSSETRSKWRLDDDGKSRSKGRRLPADVNEFVSRFSLGKKSEAKRIRRYTVNHNTQTTVHHQRKEEQQKTDNRQRWETQKERKSSLRRSQGREGTNGAGSAKSSMAARLPQAEDRDTASRHRIQRSQSGPISAVLKISPHDDKIIRQVERQIAGTENRGFHDQRSQAERSGSAEREVKKRGGRGRGRY